MKKNQIIIFIFLVVLLGLSLFEYYAKKNISTIQNDPKKKIEIEKLDDKKSSDIQVENVFQSPLDKANERVTKKPFGIYVTLKNSPIQPERFAGYHTGTDFEIFPEEFDNEIPIKAVCSGKLKIKKYASGYGGLAVQSCKLNEKPIAVIYGHLKLTSISAEIGDDIDSGDAIGILGADKSQETDRERKHLHLGFHDGSDIDIRGYVQKQSELSNWINPCLYACL